MDMTPCTTSIRRNRVHNIDTDRLIRRLDHLDLMFARPWDFFAHTTAARHRVAERHAIRLQLVARGVTTMDALMAQADQAAALAANQPYTIRLRSFR